MTSITISLWVNPTTLADGSNMILKDSTNGNCSYSLVYDLNGFVTFNSCSGGFYGTGMATISSAAGVVSTSTWTHLAVVSTGGTAKLYKNGVEISSGSFPYSGGDSTIFNSNSAFSLGGGTVNGSATYMNGKLDDARVYNRALSALDIAALYNNPGEAYMSAGSTEQTASLGSEVVGPSPTLYWEFDQGQGTTAKDGTTNGLDGTLNNTPTWQTENFCVASKCLYFPASNQNVSIADNDKLDFASANNFTVGAWVKRSGASAANTVILQKTGANIGSTYTGYKLYMDASGDFCFDIQDGTNAVDSACTSAVDFDDNSWHFVQGVKAGTTSITLFVDGKQRAQDASIASTGTLANASTFRVGIDSDGTSNDWLGFIDEVKIFRDETARTAAQVAADYNSRSNPEGVSQQQGNNNQNMPNSLSNGLLGYWKADQTSWNGTSGEAIDSSGNSLNGTAQGGATTTASGKFNYAANLDGTNDYVSVSHSSNLNLTNAITLSAWIYINSLSASDAGIARKDGEYSIRLINNGKIGGKAYGCTGVQSASTPSTGSWHHVAWTYDLKINKVYIDGNLDNSSEETCSIPTTSNAFEIGIMDGYFNGRIDEIRVYNRTLSPSELSQLYNWAPGPAAYWRLDEGSGSTAYDSSGNGNNSTSLSGSPTWTSGKYGKTINFDGTDDAVNINESTTTDFGKAGQSYTVMAWVKNNTSSTVTQPILSKNASSDAPGAFQLRNDWNTNKPQFYITNSNWSLDSNVSGTTTIRDGKWHHVAGIRNEDTNQVYIYVDGRLEGTATDNLADTDISSDKPVIIGGESNGGTYWPGGIDDVKLYNYARTAKQIVEDMNAGHPAPGSPVATPIGHWKFDEGYATTANNSGSAGSLLPGTLTNMDSPATSTSGWANDGRFNKALSFNGSSSSGDYVNIPYHTSLNVTTDITLTAWIKKAADADYGGIISKTDGSTLWDYDFFICDSGCTAGNNYLGFFSNSATPDEIFSNRTLTGTDWHHVAITRSGSTVTFYIDGQAAGGGTMSGSFASNSLDLKIGTDGTGSGVSQFNGKIDEPKLYNQALTADQIKLDYNKSSTQILGAMGNNSTAGSVNAASQEYCIPGDSTTCTGPVARWDFENQSSNNQTHYDTSGNDNNCTDFNGKALSIGKVGKSTDVVDGVGGSMTCGSGSTLDNLPASGMTIEGWLYPDSAGEFNQGMIARKNGYYTNGWWFNFNSSGTNSLGFNSDHATTDLSRTTANNTITLNTWNHVALTWTGSTTATTVKIYINGRETTYSTTTDGVGARASDAAEDWAFGDDGGGTASFDGKIDQFRTFNYVRTPAQIAFDYNRGSPLAYWKFDECQGTTINDSSGNSLSGTWSGSGGSNTSAGNCNSAGTAWGDGVTGKRNYSMDFDGSDDTVNFGSPTLLKLTDSIGISMWVKPDSNALSSGEHAMIHNYDGGGTTGQYEVAFINGALEFNYGAASSYVSYNPTPSISFTAGNWYHIVFTHSGSNSTGYFYVNGVKYSTNRTGSATIPSGGYGNTVVGATTYSGPLTILLHQFLLQLETGITSCLLILEAIVLVISM
jgi:hypothetical protein